MERAETFFRIALLAFSCFGLLHWMSRWIRPELAIGLLLSGIGAGTFVAGHLNIMREFSWVLFLYGLIQFLNFLLHKRDRRNIRCPGVLFFITLAFVFVFLLHGSKFVFYDNFIHWGIVTKALNQTNFFPNLDTINLSHPSYPVGSACFIYYFCEIVGITSEWFQMWAQAVLTTGMLVSLFVFCENKRSLFSAVLGILALLCSNIAFVDIPVDTLLPTVALYGIVFSLYYRDELEEKILCLLPVGIFLLSIKNSAVLFIFVVFLYAFRLMEKTPFSIKRWAGALGGSFAMLYLWKRHVAQTFGTNVSRHSMSLKNYYRVFSGKTFEDNIATVVGFGNKFVANLDVVLLLFGATLLVVLYQQHMRKDKVKETTELSVLSVITYVVYEIGLLGVYLFSMPLSEALVTAQYPRYHQTILIFCGGILLINLLRDSWNPDSKVFGKLTGGISAVISILFLCLSLNPNWDYYLPQNLENTDRARFDELIESYNIKKGGSYLLITKDRKGSYYLSHMARYLLEPQNVLTGEPEKLQDVEIDNFDYVILFDETENAVSFMEERFGMTGEEVIRQQP